MNKALLAWLAICLSGLVWSAGCGNKGKSASAQAGLPDYSSMRDEVVKRVQDGTIQPDAAGMAILPSGLELASTGGKIFVAHDPGAGLLVLFNAAAGGVGLLYAEKPLALQTKLKVGPAQLTVDTKNKDHWYGALIAI
jgi:hypothetical protein